MLSMSFDAGYENEVLVGGPPEPLKKLEKVGVWMRSEGQRRWTL